MRIFILTFPIAFIAVAALAQGPASPAPPDVLPATEVAPPADGEKSKTGLVSLLVRQGNSAEKPAATDIVTVHYTGWSSDGRLLASATQQMLQRT